MASTQTESLVFADEGVLRGELELADPQALTPDPVQDAALVQQAEDVVARVMATSPADVEARERTAAAVEAMGSQLQAEAARRSAMLKEPISKLSKHSEDGGQVANALVDLKVQVEELDPGKLDLEAGWVTRLLGLIPGVGTPLKRYFSRYESASTVIDAIMRSLKNGREQLKRDNITLVEDQKAMRALTLKLEQAVKLGRLRPDRVEVLPIELDPQRFEPRERTTALREEWDVGDRKLIMSTRPLKEMYDHPTLLGALARPEFENFCAVFVGDGNLKEDLEKKAKDLNLGDRVRFVGAVPNEKVPEYLSAADLYITCSRSDSAALGLLEAMAMGLPVVASDIPPNREWIADGQSGWLFPVGKQEELVRALQRATGDNTNLEEVAMRGRAIALARADARKNFPKLITRIEGLAAKGRS